MAKIVTTNVRHEHAELQSQDYTHELLRCCEWCRLDWHVAMGVGDERMRYGRQPNDVPWFWNSSCIAWVSLYRAPCFGQSCSWSWNVLKIQDRVIQRSWMFVRWGRDQSDRLQYCWEEVAIMLAPGMHMTKYCHVTKWCDDIMTKSYKTRIKVKMWRVP